jgi:hypothetical protein
MGCAGPRVCSPKAARTPKTILGRPFNEKIVVWMVGYLTLQILTGKIPILPHGPNQPWEGNVLAAYVEELAASPSTQSAARSTGATMVTNTQPQRPSHSSSPRTPSPRAALRWSC